VYGLGFREDSIFIPEQEENITIHMMLVAKMFQAVSAEQLHFTDFGFATKKMEVKCDLDTHRCRA
jgi:hypothetical protein